MMRRKLLCSLLSIAISAAPALATSSLQAAQQAQPLGLHDTTFTAKLLSPLSTKTSQRGDTFSVEVISPGEYEGSIIEGRVNNVKKAKKQKKAEISFAFETLTFKGRTYPIQADLKDVANSKGVKEVDDEGHAIGKTSNKKKILGTLAGGGLGALLGGLAAGGKGAAAGATIGAAAGFAIAIGLTTSGTDVEFAPGSTFTLLVSDPGR